MASASPPRFPLCGGRFRLALCALLALASSVAAAAPISIERIQEIAGGIASSVQVSYASGAAIAMAQAVSPMEATVSAVVSTNNPGEPAFYVIDRGTVGGYVVMSADDRLDPVLVISPSGKFNATPGTPLYDLLCGDVRNNIAAAERKSLTRSAEWQSLLDGDHARAVSVAYAGISSVDDVRVAPLVQSRWNQSTVGAKNVYNYYTPNNYVCGCVATAGSQIMRYHRHPTASVAPVTRTCYVNGVSTSKSMYGGVYDWGNMPLVPTSSITDAQCQAIGKLCYDVGVSIYMSWASGGSGTGGYCLKDAFLDVFGYRNAVAFQLRSGTISDTVIKNALLANFDALCPVELSIDGSAGGHSIVGDGYGYSKGSLYVHLNLGWGGDDDAWYHLPDIGTWAGFTVVDGAVYNIFPDGTGDLLTGRVLDSNGSPVSGATVQAFDGSTVKGSTTTSANGIYALRLSGGTTYTVVASAPGTETSSMEVYLQKSVTTGTSGRYYYPGTGTVGNSWGNDFMLTMATEPVAPSVPTGVSASDGTSTAKVRITWSASSGATYYKVYRATSNSSSAATCLASSVTSSYYDDTMAEVGVTYYYWVKAGNSSGESGFSASDSGFRAYAVPAAPTGVSASDGTSTAGVVISWSAVSSATSYSVWRSASASSSGALEIASGLIGTAYTDTSAEVGTTYWYWVRASNAGGTSGWSNSDSGYRKMAAPTAPTGVAASDGLSATEIVVSWKAIATATSYEVWRGTSSSSAAASRIASNLTVSSYSDTSAAAGKTYYYWVKATNAGGTSGFSASDTGYLAVITGPASITASDGAYAGYVRVSWQASQSATSYEVWRGTANAYSLAVKIASPTSTSCNDTSAVPGTLYYYWVRAVTTVGTSAFSASDSGYRPLAAPTGVAATTGREDGVQVSWAAVTGATSYEIGRAAQGASSSSATPIGTATSLSYTDTTAVPGVTYAYFVRAKASVCTSAWSSAATGSRSVPTPTNLTASDGTYTDRILVSWPVLSGATSYELLRADEDDIASAGTVATTTDTSFSDTTAEYGLTYYYFLRAKFAAGTSPWSASEAGWRAFPAPTGVAATDGTSTSSIMISWDAIEGATFFQIWRYSDERGRNELIGTSASTFFDDTNKIEQGVRYKYYVKAVFPTGTSAFSDYDTGYLKSASPTVVASDGTSTSQISLTWGEAPGALTYLVYRSATSFSADAEQIGSTSMLYYNDTQAAKGTLYYYWVKTATAIDTSDFGTADTGYMGLLGPSRVTATDGAYADKVVVSWSAVSGASSYDIWRASSDDYREAVLIISDVKGLSYEDTFVTPGEKNWYWVKACNVGPGLWGASDSGFRTLSRPMEVNASTNLTSGVTLMWQGASWGVSFEIKRSLSEDGSDSEIVATVSDTSYYSDDSTVPGRIYYYWIRAYSDISESSWSGVARGWRAVAPPERVVATKGTSLDEVTLKWSSATSARRYEVWRSTETWGYDNAELIGLTNKLIWVDATVDPGVPYYYWIRSVSAIDTSDDSSRVLGYISTPSPMNVAATDGEAPDYIRVTWEGSVGALSYTVWRSENENVENATLCAYEVSGTEFIDMWLMPGRYYWYWVRPVSAAGEGVFAGPDSGYMALGAPSYLEASTNYEENIVVRWSLVNGATDYDVYRAETNDIACATNDVFATVTEPVFVDDSAYPAKKYWYWVRARTIADISPLVGSVEGFRVLSVPAGITASDGLSVDFIHIIWDETIGAKSYEIWRAEDAYLSSEASLLACVTNKVEYFDATAMAGISYTYWLKAVCELSTTDFSLFDTGWRSLPAPTAIVASDGTVDNAVIVQWNAVLGALKYEVWRSSGDVTNHVFTSPDASVRTYTDSSASAGVRYRYWVRTVGATGTGVFGASDDGFRAVAPPANLNATDGSSYDHVRVTWSAVAGAQSYEVCRVATNELSCATTNIYDVTDTMFDDTNAVPGAVYRYWVRTVASLSTSSYAGPDEGYRKFQPINDVVATDGTSLDAVEIYWTMPEGATKCQVWRATDTSIFYATKIATVDGPTYSDSEALHGVKYYYWVNAVSDVEGEFGLFNDGWRGLLVPSGVQATDGDSTSFVRITWSPSPDATAYEIYRGVSSDPVSMSYLNTVTSAVYEDESAVAGTLYYYTVRAGGTGGWSGCGSADIGFKALMPPTGVSATDGTLSKQVLVTWNMITGATHYRVYRADSDAGVKSALSGWMEGTSFTDNTCSAGVRYWYYVVAAVNGTGARPSAFSAGDSGYTTESGTGGSFVDLGGGISWPVTENGDGTATTNTIAFVSVEGGKLSFSGVQGAVGSTTTVQTLVKTSLESGTVFTVPAVLTIVSEGTAVLDLSSVWGTRPALFVIGVTTTLGEVLP